MRHTTRIFCTCLALITGLQIMTHRAFCQDVLVQPRAQFVTQSREDITSLSFSGDGKLLIGDDHGAIECRDLEAGKSIAQFSTKSDIVFTSFLSGDRMFVAVDQSGVVTVFDLLQGKSTTSFRTKAKPTRATIDAGKKILAVATKDETVELFDLAALMPYGRIDARGKIENLLFLGFDRLGEQLVGITDLANVVAWNPSTLKLIREVTLSGGELHGSRSVVHAAATNREANIFVVGLEEVALPRGGGRDLVRDYSAIAYDWNTGIEVKRVKLRSGIDHLALGPGNDHVASISDEGNDITFIDLRKGELGSVVAMSDRPKVLAISGDNAWMAGGAADGKVSVWKLQYRGDARVTRSNLPSLSGRIRTNSGTEPALKPGEPVRLAILNFEAKGVPQEVGDICLSSLSNSLANFDYITLVERKQIEAVVKEQKFQASDLTDEKTSVQIGKLLNANRVLVCSIGKLGTSLILTARILDVETGKVVRGRDVICEECRDQDIYDAVKMLASTIAQ